jgi:hypothetical protein
MIEKERKTKEERATSAEAAAREEKNYNFSDRLEEIGVECKK